MNHNYTDENVESKLKEIFSYINDWLKFAEAKNAAILTLNTGALFGLSNYSENLNKVFFTVLILILLLSSIFALLSFYPALNHNKLNKIRDLFTHLSFSKKREENTEITKFFYSDIATTYNVDGINELRYLKDIYKDYYNIEKKEAFSKLEKDYAKQIIINSKITLNKYIFFKFSLNLFTIFLTCFFLVIIYQNFSVSENKSKKIIIIEKINLDTDKKN